METSNIPPISPTDDPVLEPGKEKRKRAIVAAIISLTVLAVAGYYLFRGFGNSNPKTSISPTADASAFVPLQTNLPNLNGLSPTPSPQARSGEVQFQTRQALNGLKLMHSDPQTGMADPQQDYYKLGVFGSGKYAGYDLVLAVVQFEGPGGPNYYRFAVKGAQAVMLAQNSDQYWRSETDTTPLEFTIDDSYAIGELSYPNAFRSPDGKATFIFDRFSRNEWPVYIGSRQLVRVGTLAGYGDVFTDLQPTGPATTGAMVGLRPGAYGYYLHAPDDSIRVYYLDVPFVDGIDMSRGIPKLTWTDGQVNAQEYTWTTIGGCGSTNYATVVSLAQVADQDLVKAGTAVNGDPVYAIAKSDHPYLRSVYDTEYPGEYMPGPTEATFRKIPYADFVAQKPVFFWRDPMGRLIRFLNARFMPMAECGKPVIYLYPETEKKVSVKVYPRGGMTVSDPAYGDGWNVIARPDGRLTDLASGKSYPYLFWEGRGGIYEQPKRGWSVARSEVPAFLNEQLAAFGFNDKEISDFKEFWLPRMQSAPYYFVTFLGKPQMDAIAPLDIQPRPDTVIRVLMDFSPSQQPVKAEGFDIVTPLRKGFTVTEWGGVLQ